MDRNSLDALGTAVGRQVLIRRSAQRLALYTIAEHIDAPGRAAHVGTLGLTRLEDPTAEPPATFRATVESAFTGGDPQAPVRLTEQLLGKGATGLAVLAPHGGRIEVGTDDQATMVFKALARRGKPVRAWIARGFNPTTGAHRCWHITASEISEQSFPRLGSLFGPSAHGGAFAHAVAFHGQNDREAIIVGGGLPRDAEHTALKMSLRSHIREALQAVMNDPPAVVVMRSGPLAGVGRANIVNRVTAAGNGIQLEQPAAVRTVKKRRDAIAQAVAAFYVDLI
jgi:phage replication-related protein YjqB (UPF0714/DUF867 family)